MTTLALTLDDGPDAETTPALLDLLAAHQAHATFFPMAERAAAHPGLIARMVNDGHSVGVHCVAHVRHSESDAAAIRRDTDRALTALRGLGANPVLWRTPWGDTAPFSHEVARERGLRIVGWDVDTHDWRGDRAEAMLAATRPALGPGAVILAHDGVGPGARRTDAAQTVRYAEQLIAYVCRSGLRLEAL
ncbi:MAG: polysaccharide deacetylase family protein [Actinomycetota bacterium]|nr:polysaccharide deacetylase family protein [Actinomycetota bacterium]